VYHEPRDEYTKTLFAAVPVPDPHRQRERKAERARLRKEGQLATLPESVDGDVATDVSDPRADTTGPAI
jgi:ABC-type oligopeptide transport system ATPase subunit